MKHPKLLVLGSIILLGALLGLGADFGNGDRPLMVSPDQWVALGKDAGVALTNPDSRDPEVTVQLYVKSNGQWRRAKVENTPGYRYTTP